MIIKTIKLKKIYLSLISLATIITTFSISIYAFSNNFLPFIWQNHQPQKDYIKWVDFTPTYEALNQTSKLDIESHNNPNSTVKYNWIELLSYLACKYGGDFKSYNSKDLTALTEKLQSGATISELTKNMKYYSYYYEAYNAVLHEYIGEYEIEIPSSNVSKANTSDNNNTLDTTNTTENTSPQPKYEKKYGIKVFLPIAKNYCFSHYDDFGNSRSYGYKRVHLGNDLMGSIGTPIIAVESGTVEAIGWNQYGGWRIGIRSFDKKRYYYYAHLRKDHPYAINLSEGDIVTAGDVIGYLGMTGYSTKENVNNINIPHLHFGIQLIFDESQKEGNNEIWIDVYNIIEFLRKNQSEVYKAEDEKEYYRKYDIIDSALLEQ